MSGQFQFIGNTRNLLLTQFQLADGLRIQLPGQFQSIDNRRKQLSGQFQLKGNRRNQLYGQLQLVDSQSPKTINCQDKSNEDTYILLNQLFADTTYYWKTVIVQGVIS